MYIVVKYGEKEEEIFNPNCKCVSLLSVIKDRAQLCDWNADVDLCDESGNVKNLHEFPNRCAADLVGERERLVLLRIDRKDTGDLHFTPLLNDADILTETFYSQLAARSLTSDTPRSRRQKSSRSRDSPVKDAGAKSAGKSKKPAALQRTASKVSNKA